MIVENRIEIVREIIEKQKKAGRKIGFVPTMGALHEGHLSLVEISKRNAQFHVMSIFVNRIQFNEKSDFDNYPIEIQSDLKKAEDAGVDLVFIPDENKMYDNQLTFVEVSNLTDILCGESRPGHFKGVFTVVTKLFNIVQPDIAVFGQKDIQQVVSIEKMTFDLNIPLKIIIAPIVRAGDGLALSSRNVRLSSSERQRALTIIESLREAEILIKSGETNSKIIKSAMSEIITAKGSPEKIDYISIVEYSTLRETDKIQDKCVIAVAVFFGQTRLIDNMIVTPGKEIKCVY